MKNAINWFEIPATDFDRAVKFYSAILDTQLPTTVMGGYNMAFLPTEEKGVGGAIVSGDGCEPSQMGTLVYLNAGNDLTDILSRVEPNGGSVVLPKTLITEDIGYMAAFIDSEGGKVALHSQH
ncbi:MAG: VOC family protein [Candidatus Kapaibacterium sp.]